MLSEGAATCGSCGVDLVKLKARELLSKLKQTRPAASAEPPWAKSAMFLGALAVGACLLLYGATLVVGRSAERRSASTLTAASALDVAPAPAPAEAFAESAPVPAAAPGQPQGPGGLQPGALPLPLTAPVRRTSANGD